MSDRVPQRLRQQIIALHRKGRPTGRRYPLELRAAVVSYALEEASRGASVYSMAGSLGLTEPTLRSWLRKRPRRLRTVTVQEGAPPARPWCLVTAQGHRVEGLSREDLVFLLRSLGT
jgi:transposase-like protein